MYYYFVHLRSSCYIMPLFLLLISPSALTLSDLYFRNTSPGQKQYSNTSPRPLVLVPLTQFIFVFLNTSPAHKLLYRTSLCTNVAGKARPLSVIHGIMSTILLIFSNSLDDADEWHRSHSMHWCRRGHGAIACEFKASYIRSTNQDDTDGTSSIVLPCPSS